jgi:FtsP/CotA-like multicopper oxidase with cupredoxin domain
MSRRIASAIAMVLVVPAATACGGGHEDRRGGAGGKVRTYYVAADEVTWDYAPAGRSLLTGRAFGDEERIFVARGRDRIGSRHRKAVYREYRDASFSALKTRPTADRYLGLLGPVIRAEVGDAVRVVFRNNLDRPASVHPHGLRYRVAS